MGKRKRGGTDSVEIAEVWKAFKQDPKNMVLRNRLIERYTPLVRYHAGRLWDTLPDGVDLNDLVTAGVFGLIDAINKFNLERGIKFETYCVLRIRGAMLDELRSMDWVPRLVRGTASKLAAAERAVEEEQGRPGTEAEIAEKMNLSPDAFRKLKRKASAVYQQSLQKRLQESGGQKDKSVGDILEDLRSEDPTGPMQSRDLMQLVTRGLNRQERLLIILYYYENLSMSQVGKQLGLTESRISQMHKDIVGRLKQQLRQRRSEFLN
ncbi:FliA/WhiG family RNA polymerase sigma factor [Gimesia algae]|uniref:RNA polymerase sigma factor FliA n=1 Tax=Gimesia algae TaxID=2527971 RepID=A0A517VN00_9PLAN|nr:FliA/WhiG family RNA polymerase sigma factor [Gimesia algae]QDT94290.1 RNA polymerase sigma factor FliA [Gimesia algae]